MKFHPIIDKYATLLSQGPVNSGSHDHLCYAIFKCMERSLRQPTDIMGISWGILERQFNLPGGADVHSYGWHYSEETKRIKRTFEEAVYQPNKLFEKSLEEYL